MSCEYSVKELSLLSAPIVTDIVPLLPTGGIKNGNGMKINPRKVVADFDEAFKTVLLAYKGNETLPDTFFVPDLWHIAKGDAKCVSDAHGKTLWDYCVMGDRLGRTLYSITEHAPVEIAFPGKMYRKKVA